MFTLSNKPLKLTVLLVFACKFSTCNAAPEVWNIQNSQHAFVGRAEYLHTIHHELNHHASEPKIVTITGISGIGKTSLAIEYANQHKNQYDVVWLFHGKQDLNHQMKNLYNAWPDSLPSKGNKVDIIKNQLRITDKHWLLIYDDAPNAQKVLPYIPEHHGQGKGHVLVTTLNQQGWPNVIKVNSFKRDESIVLIKTITGERDKKTANKLSERLSDYPLGLQLASNHIKHSITMDVKDYMNDIDSDLQTEISKNLLKHVTDLKANNPQAFSLLSFLSLCDSQHIPEALIKGWYVHFFGNKDLKSYQSAMNLLADLSYIELGNTKSINQSEDKYFKVHQMVQQQVISILDEPSIKKLIVSGAKTFAEVFASRGKDVLLPDFDDNIEHAKNFLKFAKEIDAHNEDIAKICIEILEYYLIKIRDYQKAKQFIEEYANIKPDKTSNKLAAKYHNNMSNLSWALGEHHKGIMHCKAGIKLTKRNQESMPELFRAYSYLIDHYIFLNDTENITKYHNEIIALINKYGFPSDKQSPNYYYMPALFKQVEANLYYGRGDIQKASNTINECESIVLEFMREFKLPDSPFLTMLTIYLSKYMIGWHQAQNENQATQIQQIIDEFTPVLPSGPHKIIGVLKLHLANALKDKDLSAAKTAAMDGINILEQWYAHPHKDLAFGHLVLGEILVKLGEAETGKQELLKAESIYKQALVSQNYIEVSELYKQLVELALVRKDELEVKKYLKGHINIFGLDNHVTKNILLKTKQYVPS